MQATSEGPPYLAARLYEVTCSFNPNTWGGSVRWGWS